MSKSSKVLAAAGLLAGVVVVGVGVGLLGTRSPGPRVAPEALPRPAAVPAPGTQPGLTPGVEQPSETMNPELTPQAPVAIPDGGTGLVTNWEDKVEGIILAESETGDKAKQMLDLFPRLPAEGQEDVARHLSNLVSDQDYAGLAGLLEDTNLPVAVLEILFGDALNRPNSLKLPALLQVAREAEHPKAAEAKEVLALFLDEDHGADWDQWQTAVDRWLKDNPD